MPTSFTVAAEGALQKLSKLLVDVAGQERLASATAEVAVTDPSRLLMSARRADDRWFCWEQPGADDFAVVGLGEAIGFSGGGSSRFSEIERSCGRVLGERLASEPVDLPPGAGPVWVGGFAFAADGGAAGEWAGFGGARMTMPEVSICRSHGRMLLTLSVYTDEDGAEAALTRVRRRLDEIAKTLAELDVSESSPAGGDHAYVSVSDASPYTEAVESALTAIGNGEVEKVVLARRLAVDSNRSQSPEDLFVSLRGRYPDCFIYCCGSPEGVFLGASPELLLRRRGAGLDTVALAGSARRGVDAEEDERVGRDLYESTKNRLEHELVRRRIERLLKPISVWVETGERPELARIANVQHLATPIHAQLAEPHSAIELAGLLHPTPAVAGEPTTAALGLIAELEGFDRGWYAGPLGWMDSAFDGDFCVALRSALIHDGQAFLYAGAGIVAGSYPEAELAETELKLSALLPLLS